MPFDAAPTDVGLPNGSDESGGVTGTAAADGASGALAPANVSFGDNGVENAVEAPPPPPPSARCSVPRPRPAANVELDDEDDDEDEDDEDEDDDDGGDEPASVCSAESKFEPSMGAMLLLLLADAISLPLVCWVST